MTIGDSIATAAIATNILPPFDKRAYSFCGGSPGVNAGYDTMATGLLTFNPDLKGYSYGNGNAGSANAALNVAVDGATSHDLTGQVNMLVDLLDDPYYPRDAWKLLSIFIGGNDLCNSCQDWAKYTPENYQRNLETLLDTIKARIPRVFVNLITPPEVTILNQIGGSGCFRFTECACKANPDTKALHPHFSRALHHLEELEKYKDSASFHVVVQPFFEDIKLPLLDGSPDKSYFAIDCFHLSSKGHSASGMGLWNNLMQPHGQKKRTWTHDDTIICPGPNQYLQ
jgi:phospholipase B1